MIFLVGTNDFALEGHFWTLHVLAGDHAAQIYVNFIVNSSGISAS